MERIDVAESARWHWRAARTVSSLDHPHIWQVPQGPQIVVVENWFAELKARVR